jgi:tetratricopeptide (TPR) repeat protein
MSWFSRFRRPPEPARVPARVLAPAPAAEKGDSAEAKAAVRAALAREAYPEAARAAERALDDCPDDVELNVLAGEARAALGEDDSALDLFHLALYYEPTSEAALAGCVRALARLGRGEEIAPAYREYLKNAPGHRGALYALALDAHEKGRYSDAAAFLERLLASHPDDIESLNLLGLLSARELADFTRGEALLRRALELAPSNLDAAANLGWTLGESGHHEEGLALLGDVLAAQPDDAEVRIMRALIDLKRGHYTRGWKDYRARLESEHYERRPFKYPPWNDEPVSGKHVLVYGEQGLGDQIMFASCVPDLLGEVASCVLDCDPRLAPIFARSFPGVTVFGTRQQDAAPHWMNSIGTVDFQLPIGDLGRRYRSTLDAFPARARYLRADPGRVTHYHDRLSTLGTGLKVGLSWRGGTDKTRGVARSVDLTALAAVLGDVPANWVSLQYAASDQELAAARAAGFFVCHWQEAITAYDETAALVEALDVVVSVCTSVVHLAGALARPVLVMVPANADWRFGYEGESMPWHPTVRLLRQSRQGEWIGVLARLRQALAGEGWRGATHVVPG